MFHNQTDKLAEYVGDTKTIWSHIAMQGLKCRSYELWYISISQIGYIFFLILDFLIDTTFLKWSKSSYLNNILIMAKIRRNSKFKKTGFNQEIQIKNFNLLATVVEKAEK